jgi:hypothetical protein
MKIIETLRQAALNRAVLTGFASLLLLFVLGCLWLSHGHVDNYYDQPIVGTPVELVAKYASHYKRLVSKESELDKIADDFARTKIQAVASAKYHRMLEVFR